MKSYTTIAAYIAEFPPAVQELLEQVRTTLRLEVPEGEEAIRYGMPTLRLGGKNLIHFAAFKSHIGLYPTPSAIMAFSQELKPFVTSKGAIQFPMERPLPLELITRITQFRVAEVLGTQQ